MKNREKKRADPRDRSLFLCRERKGVTSLLLGIVKEKPHGFYKKACCTRAFGEKKQRKLLFYGLFTREDLGFYKGLLR